MGIISADWICSITNLAICSPRSRYYYEIPSPVIGTRRSLRYGLPCCSTYKTKCHGPCSTTTYCEDAATTTKTREPAKVVTTIILFSLHGVGYTITVAQYSSDDHSGWVEKDTASEVKENNDP